MDRKAIQFLNVGVISSKRDGIESGVPDSRCGYRLNLNAIAYSTVDCERVWMMNGCELRLDIWSAGLVVKYLRLMNAIADEAGEGK